jgi:hypothetical protein
MRLRNSFWALLGHNRDVAPDGLLEDVRCAMLSALDLFCGSGYLVLDDRICCASDLDALWYLRSDLMRAIGATHGEVLARGRIAEITKMFDGFQPGAK